MFAFGFEIALDSAGLPYVGATAADTSLVEGFYTFLSAPDLIASWSDIALITKGKPKVLGHLRVLNDGNAVANGYNITCFLSDSSTASESDPVIGGATVSLAAGANRVVTFSFDPAKAPSGKYVVAQISTKPGEFNANNKSAAIMIP